MNLSGGCFCGAVRYQLSGEVFHITICHCPTCRRVAGAASVAWCSVAQEDFRWSAGAPAHFASSAGVTRCFCAACGKALTYYTDASPAELDVAVCSLDQPQALAPADHTQTRYRLPWEVIADGLPHYPGRRADGS